LLPEKRPQQVWWLQVFLGWAWSAPPRGELGLGLVVVGMTWASVGQAPLSGAAGLMVGQCLAGPALVEQWRQVPRLVGLAFVGSAAA